MVQIKDMEKKGENMLITILQWICCVLAIYNACMGAKHFRLRNSFQMTHYYAWAIILMLAMNVG